MSVKTHTSRDQKIVDIRIDGQFDFSLHQAFRESYRNISQRGITYTVNLSQATYMDSSALGMILLLKEHAEKHGGKVVLRKPNESVNKILNIANFHSLMTIET